MMDVFILLILAIASEAIAEIITSSDLFEPFRNWWKQFTYSEDEPPDEGFIQKLKVFVDKLISCGYCSSVWTSAFLAFFAPSFFSSLVVNWIVSTFVIHRLSNWIHVLYELVKKGRVRTYDVLAKIDKEP